MGQTLTHGIYLPDEGERNCYNGLAGNWTILDGAVGTVAEHTSQIAGKAPAVHTHTKSDITDFPAYGNTAGTICEGNDSRLSDARTPVAHTHTKSDVTDLLNSNFIPSANNSYDLGSSSYQWNNLYAKNYYYNGVAWGLDKANVWTGSNSFKNITLSTNAESVEILHNTWHGYEQYYTRGTSNYPNYDTFLKWNSTRYDNTLGLFKSVGVLTSTTEGATVDDIDETFAYYIYHINAKYVDFMNNVRIVNDGTSNILAPISNGTTDLGNSTNKWKTLNGINPGALSLPDTTREEPIDTTNWGYTYSAANVYFPPEDGWLAVSCSNSDYIQLDGNMGWGITLSKGYDGFCTGIIPVKKGVRVQIRIRATTGQTVVVRKASFFPGTGDPSFTVTPLNNS